MYLRFHSNLSTFYAQRGTFYPDPEETPENRRHCRCQNQNIERKIDLKLIHAGY